MKVISDQDGSVGVNPLHILNLILNGQDTAGIELPDFETDPDLKDVGVTLAVTFDRYDQIKVCRHIVRVIPYDWKLLDQQVVEVLERMEELNRKIVSNVNELNQLLEQRIVLSQKIDDDEQLLNLLDVEARIAALKKYLDLDEGEIDELRDVFFELLSSKNPEIYRKIYEVNFRPDGPVEVYISDLSVEHLNNSRSSLIEYLKTVVMAMKNKE